MSQILSQSSTIPYECADQDPEFFDELTLVESLYPEWPNDESVVSDEKELCLLNENDLYSDDTDDDNDDDIDSDDDDNVSDDFMQLEKRPLDVREDNTVHNFESDTCGCSEYHGGTACSKCVDFNSLIDYRERCLEMTVEEKDIVVKSLLFSHRHTGENVQATGKRSKVRERAYQEYYFMGIRVCRKLFCFAHCISKNTLGRISQSLDRDGIVPRLHGSKYKPSHNSLTYEERNQIKKFIAEYATENALPIPGRLPNVPQKTVLLLPSDRKFADIHNLYNDCATESGCRAVCLKTFRNTWSELCPHINISKPATDLCHKCQTYSTALSQSGKLTETEKQDIVSTYGEHIQRAQGQRIHYREQTAESKQVFINSNPVEGSPPCTLDVEYHYAWDYAQQVHYPHHSQQVGPIYFRTPRKCHVFGVCAEGSGKQTFYLIDESQCTGKGAESVVSMAHHYLKYYGIGEKHAQIHFDNAVGQNKNNLVIWYAVWRTLIEGLQPRLTFDKSVSVKQINIVEAHGLLIMIKDKGCHLYALSRPGSSHLRMVVAVGRRLFVFTWKHSAEWLVWCCPSMELDTVEGFTFVRELECFDTPQIISLIDGSKGENDGIKIDNQICVGYKHQFDLINEKNGDTLQLFQTESNKNVNLVSAIDIYEDEEAELLLSYNYVSHFQKLKEEMLNDFDIHWNSEPLHIVCAFPYVMAFTADTIEIRLIVNGNLVHTMTMPDRTLISSKCDIYFATSAYPPPPDEKQFTDQESCSTPPRSPSFRLSPSPNSKFHFSSTRFIYKIPISCLTGHVVPEKSVSSQSSVQQSALLAPVMSSAGTSPGLLRRSPLLRSRNLQVAQAEQGLEPNERHDSSSSDSGITMLRTNELSPPESPNLTSGGGGGVFHDPGVV